MSGSVAVIDIGSNSIKVLVALRGDGGGVFPLHVRSLDARISAGISQAEPRLSEDGMARGLNAIRTLLADADRFSAQTVILVATSAVRDARKALEGGDNADTVIGQAEFAPEVGHSLATATQDATTRLARRIVNMMETPW